MIVKYQDSDGSFVWIDEVENFKFLGQMHEDDIDNIQCDIFDACHSSATPFVFKYTKNGQVTLLATDATQAYLVNSEGSTIDVVIPPLR